MAFQVIGPAVPMLAAAFSLLSARFAGRHGDNDQRRAAGFLASQRPEDGRSTSPLPRTRAPSPCWWWRRCLRSCRDVLQIPPIDRDEARFAQATKQMIGYWRLRRHPFPGRGPLQEAGRHLLAAGRAGERRRRAGRAQCADDNLALPSALADRRDRRGAADLLDRARFRFAPRRGAGRIDDGERRSCSASRRGSPRPMPCCLRPSVAAMGAMARIYLGEHRIRPGLAGWILPAVFWTALAAGILIKGPLIVLFVGLTIAALADRDRSMALAAGVAAAPGHRLALRSWCALVRRHPQPLRRSSFFAESVGQDLLPQGVQRAGGAWRAAGLLLSCCSG